MFGTIFTKKQTNLRKNDHEVKQFFVWVGYLASIGYGMGETVYINLDETSIQYHHGGKKGLNKKRT